jgi:hypothetical protein
MTISLMPGMIFLNTIQAYANEGATTDNTVEVTSQAAFDANSISEGGITLYAFGTSDNMEWYTTNSAVEANKINLATSLEAFSLTTSGISTAAVTSGDTIVITPATSAHAIGIHKLVANDLMILFLLQD